MKSLKNFEIYPYDQNLYIVRHIKNFECNIITKYQARIFAYYAKTLSAHYLFFPELGIATADHLQACKDLFHKLKLLNQNSEKQNDNDPLAESIFTIFGKLLAKLRQQGIMLVAVLGAMCGFWFQPFSTSHVWDSSPISFIFFAYPIICCALSLRYLYQAAYLYAGGGTPRDMNFHFHGPFFVPSANTQDIYFQGKRAHLSLILLGLLAPLSLAAIIPGVISLPAYLVFLIYACPLWEQSDMDKIISIFSADNFTKKSISGEIKDYFSQKPDHKKFQKKFLLPFLLMPVWILFWADFFNQSFTSISSGLMNDVFNFQNLWKPIEAILFLFFYCGFFFFPLAVFLSYLWKFLKLKIKLGKHQSFTLSNQEILEKLEYIPLLAELSLDEKTNLIQSSKAQIYTRGQSLVRQGDPGDEIFIILHGSASALFRDPKQTFRQVGALGEDDVFGEVAVLDDVPRTAYVIASDYSFVLKISKDVFNRIIRSKYKNDDEIKQMIRLSGFYKKQPLFSLLKTKTIAKIIQNTSFRSISIKDVFTNEEENFCIVYSGKFAVDAGDGSQDFTLQRNDCFGFLLPEEEQQFSPKVICTESGGLLSLKKQYFLDFVWPKIVVYLDEI